MEQRYEYQRGEDAVARMRRQPRNWANLCVVALNVAVFLLVEITGNSEDVEHMLRWGAAWLPAIADGEWYRLVTCMFLHFGLTHLGNNMILLLFLGDTLEGLVGKWKYLLIYLGGGILGNICSCIMEWRTGDFYVSAGASGGVFAVMGALLVILIREKGRIGDMTAKRLGLMVALSIYHGFTATGIDGYAHLGGFLGGAVLGAVLYRRRRNYS